MKMKSIPAQFFNLIASPVAAISDNSGLIGAGPYKIKSITDKNVILIKKYGPGPSSIDFKIASENELIRDFQNNRIDDLMYLGMFKDIKEEKCRIIKGISPTVFWFGLNAKMNIFKELNNRTTIQKLLYLGTVKSKIFKEENGVDGLLPFGVGASREISSIKDIGEELLQSISKSEKLASKYGKIKLNLREISQSTFDWNNFINTIDPNKKIFSVSYLSNEIFFDIYYKKETDVYFVGANITRNDPFEVLSYFRKNDFVNPSGISDSYVDNLFEKSSTAKTSNEITFYSKKAADWVVSNGYALPLFSKNFKGCISKKLDGYQLSPLGPLLIDYSNVIMK